MFYHFSDTSFNDIGFVTGFIVAPVFRCLFLAHFIDFVYAFRVTHFDTNDVFIQQFFHLVSVLVVADTLARILLHGLTKTGQLFHCLFVLSAVLFGKALIFKEGSRLQRNFKASGKRGQCFVKVFAAFLVFIDHFAVYFFHARQKGVTQGFGV